MASSSVVSSPSITGRRPAKGGRAGEAAEGAALVGGGGLHLDDHLAGLVHEAGRGGGGGARGGEAGGFGVGRGAVVQRGDRALELEADAGRCGRRRAAGASTGSGRGGGGGGGAAPGGRISRPWPPARQTAAGVRRGEVAQVAAAEDGDRAAEPGGEAGEGCGGVGRQRDGVGVGADLGEGAVEVEEERVARPRGAGRRGRSRRAVAVLERAEEGAAPPGDVLLAHAADRARSSARGAPRRGIESAR